MIPDIPYINTGIPRITVNGTGIPFIRSPWTYNTQIRPVNGVYVADIRTWEMIPPTTRGIDPPVVINAGVPIVDMPGCVKVHKENARERNRNKNLVNDDPKGNTVLCDAGMPYYEPPNYDARELTWQTVTTEEEEAEGIDTDTDVDTDFETPGTPEIPKTGSDEVECPPPNARRIGDLNQAGTEKVIGYELTPDGKICETKWETLSFTEQYLPSIPIVSTTATIAVVATSSALLAKPLADLLLKVVKPVVKKVVAKVKKVLGKKEKILSLRERQLAQRDRNQAIQTLKKAVKK